MMMMMKMKINVLREAGHYATTQKHGDSDVHQTQQRRFS